ncbi:hypothetical protein [Neobacillus kokaensis]|uniref:Uncharacterized protein n=1 Tax=Neobacillus kokaensis TaxID=2759023 RepID=A0ABQ3N2T1_9BACI|nr:hypothetical protein [Neobacillus kokaensis]GHH99263.1 hypothetical protein AM1BK_28060 [Neobacillus kokaensis]
MGTKNIEELKLEVANLIGVNQELLEENVLPAINVKMKEFLDTFEAFFRERGFVVRRKNDSVRVSFDILHFRAVFNEKREILITRGKDQIALIPVKFQGESELKYNFESDSASQLVTEIGKQQMLSNDLKNPDVYYTGGESGPRFDDPLTILNSIFNGLDNV